MPSEFFGTTLARTFGAGGFRVDVVRLFAGALRELVDFGRAARFSGCLVDVRLAGFDCATLEDVADELEVPSEEDSMAFCWARVRTMVYSQEWVVQVKKKQTQRDTMLLCIENKTVILFTNTLLLPQIEQDWTLLFTRMGTRGRRCICSFIRTR